MPIILYAEDDRDTRELFAFVLRMSNFTVYEARNGAQAVQIVRDEPIDLATTSWTPRVSKTARMGPPAMIPVPAGAERRMTLPAPCRPLPSWCNLRPAGRWKRSSPSFQAPMSRPRRAFQGAAAAISASRTRPPAPAATSQSPRNTAAPRGWTLNPSSPWKNSSALTNRRPNASG